MYTICALLNWDTVVMFLPTTGFVTFSPAGNNSPRGWQVLEDRLLFFIR